MDLKASTLKELFEKYGFTFPLAGGELKLHALKPEGDEVKVCRIFDVPELKEMYQADPNRRHAFDQVTDQPELLWEIFDNLFFWEETKDVEKLLVKRIEIEHYCHYLVEVQKINPKIASILKANASLINDQAISERQEDIIRFVEKKLKTKNISGEGTVLLECPAKIYDWSRKGLNPRISIPVRLEKTIEGQRGIVRKIKIRGKKNLNKNGQSQEEQATENVTISISMTGTEAEALVRAIEALGNTPKPPALRNCFIAVPQQMAEALNQHYIFPYTTNIETLPADTAEMFEVLEHEQLSRAEWDPRKTSILDLLEAAFELSGK